MFYEEECKRTEQVPAPWDYADAQFKAAAPPVGTAMFSRSTEAFNIDKWYRRTVFNAPEKADTTVAYPGPGSYDPIIKAHSRCRRVPGATIGHAIPPLPDAPPKYKPLPAVAGSHNAPSESLVGRDVKPVVGMKITMSQRQKRRLEVRDDHKGIILEVDDSELFCMVEWVEPYPADEEQYALALTGKNSEYWLAAFRSPPPSPIEKKWLLDAIVSPRYQVSWELIEKIRRLAMSNAGFTDFLVCGSHSFMPMGCIHCHREKQKGTLKPVGRSRILFSEFVGRKGFG